jgi:hypothetical protein
LQPDIGRHVLAAKERRDVKQHRQYTDFCLPITLIPRCVTLSAMLLV